MGEYLCGGRVLEALKKCGIVSLVGMVFYFCLSLIISLSFVFVCEFKALHFHNFCMFVSLNCLGVICATFQNSSFNTQN
jgi:hypothetical protein